MRQLLKTAFFSILFILSIDAAAVFAQTELPEYKVHRVPAPVIIDGKLNDAAWEKAVPVDLVQNSDGAKLSYKTQAKILYDDKYLYFAFYNQDENIWATMKNRDQHLWEEEVVEVFLQPDPAKKNYIELEVNPLGAMLDIYLLDVRKPLLYESWNSAKLQWAAQADGTVDGKPGDRSWTCEIAFPLEDAVTAPNFPPKPGDTWRMNLNRVEAKPAAALLSWSPTGKNNFHMPEMFGRLVFTGTQIQLTAEDMTPVSRFKTATIEKVAAFTKDYLNQDLKFENASIGEMSANKDMPGKPFSAQVRSYSGKSFYAVLATMSDLNFVTDETVARQVSDYFEANGNKAYGLRKANLYTRVSKWRDNYDQEYNLVMIVGIQFLDDGGNVIKTIGKCD